MYVILLNSYNSLEVRIIAPGVVVHACNPSTLEGEDRRIWVRGQPQLSLSLSLSLPLSP